MEKSYDGVKCKYCQVIKYRLSEMNIGFQKNKRTDETGSLWVGRRCPACVKIRQDFINLKNHKPLQIINCKICLNPFKQLTIRQRVCNKKCLRKSRNVFSNVLKKCATCNKDYQQKNNNHLFCNRKCRPRINIYKPNIVELQCFICQTTFKTNRKQTKFCSKVCKSLYPKPKYLKPIKTPTNRLCNCCQLQFTSKGKQKYCTVLCRRIHYRFLHPEYRKNNKEYNRLRKRNIKKSKPKWVNWVDLILIYVKCPKNYTVDHIIPLKHPNVSGLHVPWNLQYLSRVENSSKNNKFDFTYNNEAWKNKILI